MGLGLGLGTGRRREGGEGVREHQRRRRWHAVGRRRWEDRRRQQGDGEARAEPPGARKSPSTTGRSGTRESGDGAVEMRAAAWASPRVGGIRGLGFPGMGRGPLTGRPTFRVGPGQSTWAAYGAQTRHADRVVPARARLESGRAVRGPSQKRAGLRAKWAARTVWTSIVLGFHAIITCNCLQPHTSELHKAS
jgi:hypothetical protein